MDIDVAKIGNTIPKLDDVKKELFDSMNEFHARGIKVSFQWYVLIVIINIIILILKL